MHPAKCTFVLLLLLLALYGTANAQDTVILHQKDFGAYNEISLRDKHWFFHPEINNANTPPDVRSIAHEFRTPLTLILNPVKELAGKTSDPSLLRDYRMILNNAERLLRLINQLLDLSKLEQGLMELLYEPLDLNALLLGHVQSFDRLHCKKASHCISGQTIANFG